MCRVQASTGVGDVEKTMYCATCENLTAISQSNHYNT